MSSIDRQPKAPSTKKDDFTVELNIPSQMDMISLAVNLSSAMMEFRGYDKKDQDIIRLAIHETLINAIKYGSKDNKNARINLRFYFKESGFYTDIEDEGKGFDLKKLDDPTASKNILKPDGRGIFLVKQMTEDFKVTALPGKGFRVTFSRLKKSD